MKPRLHGYAQALDRLFQSANEHGDPVHLCILVDPQRPPSAREQPPAGAVAGAVDGAVVVLRGADTVECFRQWALRNHVLTQTPRVIARDPNARSSVLHDDELVGATLVPADATKADHPGRVVVVVDEQDGDGTVSVDRLPATLTITDHGELALQLRIGNAGEITIAGVAPRERAR